MRKDPFCTNTKSMPAIGVGSMRKYQRKVKESQPWSVATTSNLVGPWAVLAVWPAMKVALVAYWGVEIYLGDVVGWVGMERGDGGCEKKVGGGGGMYVLEEVG